MQTITVPELKARLQAGEKINLLDVREPDEYAEQNLNGVLIPLGKVLNGQIEEIEDWRDKEVIIHCRSGKRSFSSLYDIRADGLFECKKILKVGYWLGPINLRSESVFTPNVFQIGYRHKY
jgi:rhodanese-related sulfurtransferase